jgi:hypothetical protein
MCATLTTSETAGPGFKFHLKSSSSQCPSNNLKQLNFLGNVIRFFRLGWSCWDVAACWQGIMMVTVQSTNLKSESNKSHCSSRDSDRQRLSTARSRDSRHAITLEGKALFVTAFRAARRRRARAPGHFGRPPCQCVGLALSGLCPDSDGPGTTSTVPGVTTMSASESHAAGRRWPPPPPPPLPPGVAGRRR